MSPEEYQSVFFGSVLNTISHNVEVGDPRNSTSLQSS